jgi:Flp pilus assembly protein TadD
VLEASGLPADPSLPGTSLGAVIAGRSGPDRPVYFEALMPNLERGWAPLRGVVSGRWKYIDLPIPELYDLPADPGEVQNLASTDQAQVDVLRNILKGFDLAPPSTPMEEPAAVADRLRSLGYVGLGPAAARDRYTDADDPKRLIDLDRRMQTASTDAAAGKTQAAVDLLQAVIAERPDNAEAYLNLAVVFWEAGRRQEAITTLEGALTRGITRREIRSKLGMCLALVGEGRRAIPLLEGLTADDPEALNALGLAYAQVGRDADAKRAFRQVLDVDPSNGLAEENIGLIELSAGDLTAAEASLGRALSIDPTLAGAHAALGDVYAATGRQTEAMRAWTAALAVDPDQHSALWKLAIALAETGRLDEARRYGDRFLQIASPEVEAAQIAAVRRAIHR